MTRQNIIDELNKLENMTQDQKRLSISNYLDSQGVGQEEKEKILSDLISYAEF